MLKIATTENTVSRTRFLDTLGLPIEIEQEKATWIIEVTESRSRRLSQDDTNWTFKVDQ